MLIDVDIRNQAAANFKFGWFLIFLFLEHRSDNEGLSVIAADIDR